jgi:hypothetical protein
VSLFDLAQKSRDVRRRRGFLINKHVLAIILSATVYRDWMAVCNVPVLPLSLRPRCPKAVSSRSTSSSVLLHASTPTAATGILRCLAQSPDALCNRNDGWRDRAHASESTRDEAFFLVSLAFSSPTAGLGRLYFGTAISSSRTGLLHDISTRVEWRTRLQMRQIAAQANVWITVRA